MIIGKNNAGKTTIITALDNLINHSNAFGVNDFNYRYLQKIYNMICENLHLPVEQVMAELDISRATVFRDYAKIKKVTGAMYDKKTSTWTL